jgi:hypothetical protein
MIDIYGCRCDQSENQAEQEQRRDESSPGVPAALTRPHGQTPPRALDLDEIPGTLRFADRDVVVFPFGISYRGRIYLSNKWISSQLIAQLYFGLKL